MKARFLFSHKCKKWGWIITMLTLALGIPFLFSRSNFEIPWLEMNVYHHQFLGPEGWAWSPVNLTGTLAGSGLIIGLSLIAFSRLKEEDEFTSRIRLESLQWAVYVNYALLLLAFLLIYDITFLNVLVYNLFTILLIFIIRFHWILYQQKRLLKNEK